jgi:hypothetical protein
MTIPNDICLEVQLNTRRLAGQGDAKTDFDKLMLDKFIASDEDEDKYHFVYRLINATGASNTCRFSR